MGLLTVCVFSMIYSDSIIRQYHFNVKTGTDTPLIHAIGKTEVDADVAAAKAAAQGEVNADAAKCCD